MFALWELHSATASPRLPVARHTSRCQCNIHGTGFAFKMIMFVATPKVVVLCCLILCPGGYSGLCSVQHAHHALDFCCPVSSTGRRPHKTGHSVPGITAVWPLLAGSTPRHWPFPHSHTGKRVCNFGRQRLLISTKFTDLKHYINDSLSHRAWIRIHPDASR